MVVAKQRFQSRQILDRGPSAPAEDTIAFERSDSICGQELIAELTSSVIERMDRDELIDIIRSVQIPFLRAESLRRLEYWDTPTLRRVMHLACRCYQPQYY